MPYLGDYMGHLLSELTIARMQADLEALRVAELYTSDTLLRHFPVPRFRLNEVTMEFPVAIQKMEEVERGGPPRGRIDVSDMTDILKKQVRDHLATSGIHLPREQVEKVMKDIDLTVSRAMRVPEVAVNLKAIAHEVTLTTSRDLETMLDRETLEKISLDDLGAELRDDLEKELVGARELPPRLEVLINTGALREVADQEYMAKIRLSVTEEAVEWTILDRDGRKDDLSGRLVPE